MPKACMISHDAVLSAVVVLTKRLKEQCFRGPQHAVSYLPLSHVAGWVADIIIPIVMTAQFDDLPTTVGW